MERALCAQSRLYRTSTTSQAVAFLAPDVIAEEIIVAGAVHLGPLMQPFGEDLLAFHEALAILGKYSLIRREPSTKTVSVHRLVQAVLRETLEQATQRTWAERVVLTVNAVFPRVEYAAWPQCERLLSQALVAGEYIERYQLVREEAVRLLVETASYLQDRARYGEAEPLSLRALSILEQQLGLGHPEVAEPLNVLALLYKEQGRFAEAEPLSLRALSILEQLLGPHHPNVATPLNGLAELYKEQGKYEEAEPLYLRALSIREQHLGPDHPDTAETLHDLAVFREQQGHHQEALALLERALSIREQALGLEHPKTRATRQRLSALGQAISSEAGVPSDDDSSPEERE